MGGIQEVNDCPRSLHPSLSPAGLRVQAVNVPPVRDGTEKHADTALVMANICHLLRETRIEIVEGSEELRSRFFHVGALPYMVSLVLNLASAAG